MFDGILPAITTPFREDLQIDFDELERSIDWLIENGVHGIVANGTMGEYRSLTSAERNAVAATAVSAVGGRVPVTVGVSSDTAAESAGFAEFAAVSGASAVMCLPPITYRADADELRTFFSAVADATDLPMMIYNNPSGSRHDLDMATLTALRDSIPSVRAVKDSSEDARRLAAIRNLGLEAVVGGDDTALEGLAGGATGWVSGVAVVAPRECVLLFDQVSRGELRSARETYDRLMPMCKLDVSPKLVQYYKRCLDGIGRYGGPSRPPRLPLASDEEQTVAAALDRCWPNRANVDAAA